MKNNSIFSDAWCNLVFEGRNQQYGAYRLRKISDRNTLSGLFVAVCFISVSLGVPFFISLFHETVIDYRTETEPRTIELYPPVEVPKIEKPPSSQRTSKLADKETMPVISTDGDEAKPKEDPANNTAIPGDLVDTMTVETTPVAIGTYVLPLNVDTIIYPPVGLEFSPVFPGGEEALFEFYKKHVRYPVDAYERNKTGTVYISFVINTEGKVSNVSILRGVEGVASLGAEACRVTSMLPAWKPGRQNGRPVNVRFTVPVSFHLQ